MTAPPPDRKLVDSDPSWIGTAAGRRGVGITFECPLHPGGGCYQGVFFANPLDGGPPLPDADAGKPGVPERKYWQRTGDTFETLTLTPSINAFDTHTAPDGTKSRTTHWHGFITNGRVTSC